MGLVERIRDREGLVLMMSMTQARTPNVPAMAAAAGFDCCMVDLEHQPITSETAGILCAAALGFGMVPFVRVASHDAGNIGRALDFGAVGIVVPHVESREEAARLVEACRFPPAGVRSISSTSPILGYRQLSTAELMAELEAEHLLLPMLESPTAIANAGEIAAVDGVAGLIVGPHDLCVEMGVPGQLRDERCQAALHAATHAARSHGKLMGVLGLMEMDILGDLIEQGLRLIGGIADTTLLMQAARSTVATLRALDPHAAGR